ncbi:NADH-quinone oxidoreductase subunit NuoH [Kibdelosporangium phytohabitans]|uniref:NADH-quinone oxidoreductase subunit H n=1 Tax=Kibdelosporangium phytohabitans TaxID=860235 RepID=A0A0N9IC96_9PSEU|nr:NADH-quinone oxidoreductase subunit NuoH [Kibdelosporangium phytohabitans]ALG13972.1 NADH-quinone oxidoreductase subunit H [Kibdelosporangium phytohabitans]MBE1467079.1 NADH-quinone oxidoreductase subunit H [Kibdelosporangium phytohabitans]
MTRAQLLADDPIWLILLKVLFIFLFALLTAMITVWAERRLIGRMQNRPGPNRVGPFGLLQPIADAIKMPFKEEIVPRTADKVTYRLAPVIALAPTLIGLSVMPFGPEVSIFGERTVLQLVDLPVGALVVLAAASVGVYGVILAGWSSGTPYPLLGGLRSAAQVISYEIAMGLAIVAVILQSHSLSLGDIVDSQHGLWFGVALFPAFFIYIIAMVGETNRAPFDLPEAESELVAGFHTEYSSMKFVIFYIAEYINMIVVCAMGTTLFLGGYMAPWPISLIGDNYFNSGWWPMLWFIGKIGLGLFFFIWIRGTLPRYRYDQFMKLGWKFLVPLSLLFIVVLTIINAWPQMQGTGRLISAGFGILVLIGLAFMAPDRRDPKSGRVPMSGGGFPVPPIDLQIPNKPRRTRQARSRAGRRQTVAAGAKEGDDGVS